MENILTVKDLKVRFLDEPSDTLAVKGISFSVGVGELVGLVGESGSGKSVSVMSLCGLISRDRAEITGDVVLDGTEVLKCNEAEVLDLLGEELGFVFQDPMTSLDPVMKIGPQVEEALSVHTKLTKKERHARAIEAMRLAELSDPERIYNKYPHELSGGMLQRVMIAAAIISRPKLLIADEPTTALDVTIQAEILELLKHLNKEHNMAVLIISHDLHVVRKLCTKVIVMRRGELVEDTTVEEIFRNPKHEYTKTLINAIPTRNRKLK